MRYWTLISTFTMLPSRVNTGTFSLYALLCVALTFSTGLGNDPVFDVLYGVAQGGVGISSVLVTYSKFTGLPLMSVMVLAPFRGY